MPSTATSHEAIPQRLIAAIEQGQVPPWRRPISDRENDGFPTHPTTLEPYRGVDVLLLNMAMTEKGYSSKFWAGVDEWAYLDSQVCGQPTILVDGTAVFNADQTLLSLGSVVYRSRKRRTPLTVNYDLAEKIIAASGADIRHVQGTEAAYYYDYDFIVFPEPWQFEQSLGGKESYYDAIFHELAGHWTEPRLGWSASPAVNELRAEIASAFTTARLGLPAVSDMKKLINHRNHLSRWIKAIQSHPTLIFNVAQSASDAVDYLLGLAQPATKSTVA